MPSQSLKFIKLFYSLTVLKMLKLKNNSILRMKLVLIDSVSSFNTIQLDDSKRNRKIKRQRQSDVNE